MRTAGPASDRPAESVLTVGSQDQDWTPSRAVVDAVSDAAGLGPTEIDPLYEVIDPDALDALLMDAPPDSTCSVTFEYLDYLVIVEAGGTVVVQSE